MKRWLLLFALLIVLAGTALTGLALTTETGLRWTLAVLSRVAPGELAVETARGRLLGPFHIGGLHYRSGGGTAVTVDRLDADWHAQALLRGTLDITHLRAQGIRVLLPPKKEPSPPRDVGFRLPFRPVIEDGAVDDIVIARDGSTRPIVIERITLDSRLADGPLYITGFQIQGPKFLAKLHGSVGAEAPYPIELATEWAVTGTAYGSFQGTGRLAGPLNRLTVSQTLAAPFAAHLDGTLYDPLERLRWEATLQASSADLQDLRPKWPALPLDTVIEGSGNLDTLQATGKASTRHARLGEVHGTFRLARLPERWTVEELVLDLPGLGGRISTQGYWTTRAQALHLEFQGNWQRLAWPTANAPTVQSPTGTFAVRGSPDSYQLNLSARLSGAQIPTGTWSTVADGSRTGLSFSTIRAELLEGVLEGKGTLRWSPEPSWVLNLSGRDLNPGAAWPDWRGSVALAANTEGALRNGRLTATAQIEHATGTLRGYPLTARSRLEINGDTYRLTALELRSGTANLRASGKVADAWNLNWEIRAPDLAALLPASSGAFNGSGEITGPRQAPMINARLTGRDIALRNYHVARLQGELALGLQRQKASTVDLSVDGLRLGPRAAFQTVRLQGRGTSTAHELSLNATTAAARLRLQASGALVQGLWQGRITQADVNTGEYGRWALQEPAALQAGRDQAALKRMCWRHESAHVCAGMEWQQTTGWGAELQLDRLPLALFQTMLAPQTAVTGTLSGTANGTYSAEGILRFQASLAPSPGTLRYATASGEQVTVPFRDARLQAEAAANRLRAHLSAAFGEASMIDSMVELPRFNSGIPFAHQPLAGHVQLTVQELDLIPAFVPAAESTSGSVKINLALGGTLGDPRISGNARLSNGAADVPGLGVRLQDITLEAHSAGDESLQFEGSARSGEGALQINGRVLLNAEQGWPINATLRGERFLVMSTSQARIWTSPDLALRTQGNRADIQGTIHIPEAQLSTPDKRKAVQASPDVVIVNDGQTDTTAAERTSRWRISSRIRITLGDKVSFSGFGVDGRIKGEVLVTEEPGKVATGSGELQIVDGKYEAYGQKLAIEYGRMVFAASPIDNPALDVRAVRRIGEASAIDRVIAGIQVRGRLKSPEITLVSEPAMSDSETLSYLLLGQPLNQASAPQGEFLTEAATSLGVKGGELLAKQIGAAFGIQDIHTEEGGTSQEAALVLGTYLSPRLYIGYGVGLVESINFLRIRYQLSRKWVLQTRTGIQSSADLLYTIER